MATEDELLRYRNLEETGKMTRIELKEALKKLAEEIYRERYSLRDLEEYQLYKAANGPGR